MQWHGYRQDSWDAPGLRLNEPWSALLASGPLTTAVAWSAPMASLFELTGSPRRYRSPHNCHELGFLTLPYSIGPMWFRSLSRAR